MNLLIVLVGIAAVFVTAFVASVVITRLSGAGRLVKVDLAEILSKNLKSGLLLDTVAELELIEFEGLDTPFALVLVKGDTQIQASIPDGMLDDGVGITSLLPGDPGRMSGSRRSLGTFRVIGQIDEFPVMHLKVKALVKV